MGTGREVQAAQETGLTRCQVGLRLDRVPRGFGDSQGPQSHDWKEEDLGQFIKSKMQHFFLN